MYTSITIYIGYAEMIPPFYLLSTVMIHPSCLEGKAKNMWQWLAEQLVVASPSIRADDFSSGHLGITRGNWQVKS